MAVGVVKTKNKNGFNFFIGQCISFIHAQLHVVTGVRIGQLQFINVVSASFMNGARATFVCHNR